MQLKDAGVNRLSIGIQSFDDHILKFLNRAHNSQDAMICVANARQAGFQNISIDLIYAINGQGHNAWRENISKAIALKPDHISAYSLTIEENTVFGKWSASGKQKPVDDEIAATQLEILINELEAAGFEQYEISNFSKPGFHSRHNSNYWKQAKYLGVGPSAHSYNGASRQFNVSNNYRYLNSIKQREIPFQLELLSREDKINEYLLTTLRTSWGCDLGKLKNDFGEDILGNHAAYVGSLINKNLALLDNSILKLTKSGKLLADKIASDLFLLKE
jgi:oxygen-independent coproporphyrinogen-3 oxidase